MASCGQLVTRKTQEFYARGAEEKMKRKCSNCRWWQKVNVLSDEVCLNEDAEDRFEQTHEDFICPKWEQVLEQDGNATWYFDGK